MTSSLTGKSHTMDLPVTQDQISRYERREGLVQQIFPHLSPDQREFLKTGITPEEWKSYFGSIED
jgi:hypothetical protein